MLKINIKNLTAFYVVTINNGIYFEVVLTLFNISLA